MAFTGDEKRNIRELLGWPERFLQSDSALERAIDAVENRPDAETRIRSLLSEADDLFTEMLAARKRLKAHKAGEHLLDAGYEIDEIQALGRLVSGRIASMLGVEVRHDAWAAAGPRFRSGFYGPQGDGNTMSFG